MVKTLIIILSLITLVGLSVVAFEVIEYDADGNPIESTEIPADQIPPDSRPAVHIPKIDATIELAPIITAYTNATIEMTPAIRDSIFDNYSAIAQGLSAISVISNTDAEVVIVDASRGTRTTIDKATGMATISNAITGRTIKVVPYSSKLPEIIPSQGTLKQEIQQAEQGIKDYVKFIETAHPRNYVTDQRTLAYMQNIEDTPEWREWQAIYSADYPPIKHVPVGDITEIRMLAEMRAAESNSAYENLVRELKYFKTLTYSKKEGKITTTHRQYNTVLAVWEGEDPSRLLQQIALAKSLGYKVFFAYGKREKLQDEVFINPTLYRQVLKRLAKECDGYFIGWRRTGLHLLQKQEKFVEYSMQCVREANPNILIFGEGYFGFVGNHNADGTPKMDDFKVYVPANASGARVVNFGYPGIRPEGVMNFVRKETQVPLIAMIVGEKAYYMTTHNTNKTKAQNRSIIKGLEARFRNAGFGVATLAGDGSNELYNKDVSDDLCKSQWSKTTISN